MVTTAQRAAHSAIVMGHEAAVRWKLPRGVTKYSKGDRVTFDSTVIAASARTACASNHLCDNRQVIVSPAGSIAGTAHLRVRCSAERIMYKLPGISRSTRQRCLRRRPWRCTREGVADRRWRNCARDWCWNDWLAHRAGCASRRVCARFVADVEQHD